MPHSTFRNAPRFHTGIGPGELPAIIRNDESVLTPGQMRQLAPVSSAGGGDVTVNVMNAPAGTNAEVKTSRDPGGNLRVDVMLKRVIDDSVAGLVRGGQSATHDAIKDRFGLNPRL